MTHLVDVAPEQRAHDGRGLHDHDEVPVNERLVTVRMPPVRIEEEVCKRSAHNCHIA